MNESWRSMRIRSMIPDDLNAIVSEVSFSYSSHARIASKHLRTIYGHWADPREVLAKYSENRHIPDGRTAPLLNRAALTRMIDESIEFQKRRTRLLELTHLPETAQNLDEKALLLGIHPDSDENTPYWGLVLRNQISKREWVEIRRRYKANLNLVSVICGILVEPLVAQIYLEYDNIGGVIIQPRTRYYYRGENAVYPCSRASLHRDLQGFNREIAGALYALRCGLFGESVDQLNAVRGWCISPVNYVALAQHYGLHTHLLDITSDLMTALFFACCKYDPIRGWQPLNEADIEGPHARPRVIHAGGDPQHALLFRAPCEIADLELSMYTVPEWLGRISPIGYQPFARCSAQFAYMLNACDERYDLQRDPRFEMFRIELTPELCAWIYHNMDCGRRIYPNEGIPDISHQVSAINSATVFPRRLLTTILQLHQIPVTTWARIQEWLEAFGVRFVDSSVPVFPSRVIAWINEHYAPETARRMLNIMPRYRPTLVIDGNFHEVVGMPKNTAVAMQAVGLRDEEPMNGQLNRFT